MLTGEDHACLVDDPGEAGEWSQLAMGGAGKSCQPMGSPW